MPGRFKTLRKYQRTLGLVAGARWSLLRSADFRGLLRKKTVQLHPRVLAHPVHVRMQGSSDQNVFEQIFVRRDFDVSGLLDPPQLIFDLGANVGYSAAVFLSLFPGARVLAVEPDPDNAELCSKNLTPYGDRARVVKGAVWHSRTSLVLSRGTFGDGREWATEVREVRGGETGDVDAWDIPSLLALIGGTEIGLLKIDIEGSEAALFSCGTDRWLDRVRNLFVELHGPACEQAVIGALREYDYDCSRSGEYMVCLNLRRRPNIAVAKHGTGA